MIRRGVVIGHRVSSSLTVAGVTSASCRARVAEYGAPVAPVLVDSASARLHARFAGHSKKRSSLFSKLCREITAAAKVGGSDPDANIRLAAAIDRGKAANLPRDNIENAIKRATESSTAEIMETVWYEGRGPGGTAVLIKVLTDNRKRTAPALRSAFSKSGGELGTSGSVAWMFETTGRLAVPLGDDVDADGVMEAAIEAGADDVLLGDAEVTVVLSDPKDLATVKDALSDSGYAPSSVSVEREPQNLVELDGTVQEQFAHFLDVLDDNEDVQEVHHNAAEPDDDEEGGGEDAA